MTAREPDTCSWPYRVRFDEAGPDGLLRTSTLLRYAQDLAAFHSAQRGFDRVWYAERGLAWLARTAAVAVTGSIGHGAELTGTTRVVGARRVWARRRTEFTSQDGALVAWAHVDWVLLDARGTPIRIPPDLEAAFGTPGATFPLGRVDVGEPPEEATHRTFSVRPHELDPMDHANNAVYADWLDEGVIAAGGMTATRAIPRIVRLEYALPAEPEAVMAASTWPVDGGWSYRLTGPQGTELLRARIDPG